MFHMGWFVGRGYSVHAWNQPWSGTIGTDYMRPDLYIDLVRAMERACFDYVMIEDGSFVPDAYGGTPEWYLHNAYTVPKHDPMPLVPLLTQGSSHLGIVATMTTGFYPPYLAARLGATLDHLTQGRVGLNLVTAHNDRTAQNFGLRATTSTTCATRSPTNGSRSSIGCGSPGSPTPWSPIRKAACMPISARSIPSTSSANTSARAAPSTCRPARSAGR